MEHGSLRAVSKLTQRQSASRTPARYMSELHRREILRLFLRLREWIDAYVEQVKALPADSLNADQKEQWLSMLPQARDSYR